MAARAWGADAALEKTIIRVVGFDEGAETALVHVEKPGKSGEPDLLYLAVVPMSGGWIPQVFDGYEGLPEWKKEHPDATPEQLDQAARKLRGSNWKKMEKELGLKGVKTKDGATLKLKYVIDGKLAPVAREDSTEGTARVSRFQLPTLDVALKQSCATDSAKTCSLVSERGSQRVQVGSGYDVEAVYVEPGKGRRVVVFERGIVYRGGQGVAGLHALAGADLQPAPEVTRKPGQVFAVVGCDRTASCETLHEPKLDARSGSVDSRQTVKIVRPASPGPVPQTQLVAITWPSVFGGWDSAWIHCRHLAPEPVAKAVASLLDLKLVDSVVGSGDAARYRLALRNDTTEAVQVPTGVLAQSLNTGRCIQVGTFQEVPEQRLAPGSEVVLFDGMFEYFDEACGTFSKLTGPSSGGPIERVPTELFFCLEFPGDGSPAVATCQDKHTLELPARIKKTR